MDVNYTHLRCSCGGIIGMYDREHFSCEKCEKLAKVHGKYDKLMINDKTSWIFPMIENQTNPKANS